MPAPQITLGDAGPSIVHVIRHADRFRTRDMLTPCHALVRPPRVRAGLVLDATAPLDADALQAARRHYRSGGIVRLHARRPADLETARKGIRE